MKNKYIEIDFDAGITIEECVNELLYYKSRNKLAYGSFNGHLLYSDTVTLDSAFQKIIGKTKEEYDNSIIEERKKIKAQEQEHLNSMSDKIIFWKEEGRKILDKSKWELWDKIVPIRLKDLYNGMELGGCLNIIKLLNNGTYEEAKSEFLNQGHSGMSFGLMCSMLRDLAPNGEDFVYFVRNN